MTAGAGQSAVGGSNPGGTAGEQTRRPPGALVLLRNGQSQADARQVFAGLLDPPLTEVGLAEAGIAAQMLSAHRIGVDLVVSSPLSRATQTAQTVADRLHVPTIARVNDSRLLPRGLGCLTGLAKRRALERFGHDSYLEWRYALDGCPPPASHEQAASWQWRPTPDLVDDDALLTGESLRDVVTRVTPVWLETLRPELAAGRTVLVVAHGDSLRGLRVVVENLTGEALRDGSLTPAQPLVYRMTAAGGITGPGRYIEVLDSIEGN